MKLRAMFFDIYGTILCDGDEENAMPVRTGFISLINTCRRHNVLVYSASDSDLTNLWLDLDEVLRRDRCDHKVFDGFFRFEKNAPKDFSQACEKLGLDPGQVLIIGDGEKIDLALARELGCQTVLVPPYDSVSDNYNLAVLAGYL